MHPAPSVIIFSTLSGAGFGLLAFLGIGLPETQGLIAFTFYLIAYLLAVGGLFSAFFHLRNKRNAWRSYSQWRTSWLSREAWAAVAALLTMGAFAIGQIVFGVTLAPLGWIGAALSLATVLTTAMIYAQLRAVPRWNQWATPAVFLTSALAGGALLSGTLRTAIILLISLILLVCWHWWKGDRRLAESRGTIATATRLPGAVSVWERGHTGETYVTREMVFRIARRHAVKLRAIALVLMAILPVLVLVTGGPHHLPAALAVLSHLAGVAVQRWLFFAEAEHVVGLYYGAGEARGQG